jgi:hypothetical protein
MGELKITDEQYNSTWRAMLKVFHGIIAGTPPVEKVKKSLLDLCQSAENTNLLTGNQKAGINGRCQSYINGTYGLDPMKKEYMDSKSKT